MDDGKTTMALICAVRALGKLHSCALPQRDAGMSSQFRLAAAISGWERLNLFVLGCFWLNLTPPSQ